ncbi:MAG TPA: hypothetical protein VFH17_03820 [Coriobacteriia bacterium]|nr:hypothetical protein [Coriobacteriia bacterium]
MEEGPAGLVWQILDLRSYEALWRARQQRHGEDDETEEIGDDDQAQTLERLMREIEAEVDGEIADEALGRRRDG